MKCIAYFIGAKSISLGPVIPVPVAGGDYIRVNDSWGPNALISQNRVKAKIKVGDRLIGWAMATWPTCPKRFYWVYIKQGEGGWYAELDTDQFINLTAIQKLLHQPDELIEAYKNIVPAERRIPIQ